MDSKTLQPIQVRGTRRAVPSGVTVDLIIALHCRFQTWLSRRADEPERGASLVEYALLVALIAVVCIAAVSFLGQNASTKFNAVGSKLR
jgi:pilus assembly protein Flp/PilA